MAAKLRTDDILKISDRLLLISKIQPSEFQRKCRSLHELHNFKGTEFRSLIMYILPVAVKDIVPHKVYQNMLTLHGALLILIDPTLSKSHSSVAQKLLELFVISFGTVYGEDHLVYNVHSLLHIGFAFQTVNSTHVIHVCRLQSISSAKYHRHLI